MTPTPDTPTTASHLTSPLHPTNSATPLMQQSITSPSILAPSVVNPSIVTADAEEVEEITMKSSPVPEPPTPKVNLRILVISGQSKVYSFEPSTTIGRVKELIWNMWPSDWTRDPTLPPSPSYFRILYLGRVLEDEADLASLNFRIEPAVTIVHLAVRTFAVDEEPLKKSLIPTFLRPPTSRQNSIITALPTSHLSPSTTPAPVRRNTGGEVRNGRAQTRAEEGEGVGGCKCVIM